MVRVILGLCLGIRETIMIKTTQNLRNPNPQHYWQEPELYNCKYEVPPKVCRVI